MDIKDVNITIPIICIDDDWCIELNCCGVNGQDTNGRDEVWCYFHDTLLCTFTDLNKFLIWFKLTTKKNFNEEQNKKNY